ncbi:A/G-specific adenine glycosylase [Erysipelothrix sp. HDW6C]|uniref:A/G-specific adenine glycosylase n=1 Tax=Erysipelothrix sp. HDW6C TaxID=2714930 RepID=UPI0014079EA0|nr:A/G-specific adenine glycosylase [Erysipelothrix sp. HDW6C]QIK69255.1 A/G-specific adenine glycosylase [Erysipelothrix sp. HDW6C]
MTFTDRLITWYRANKRELPFRSQRDPYKIWVSEIMAQQTQIATMIPYYNRWIEKYPTVDILANADIDEVLKMWEGLGYYRRARNLHKGAQYVVEHFDSSLPADKKKLMEIPGIGDYTSSAIASIAFDLPEIVIDGNVKRVMARYLNYTENVNARKAHTVFDAFLKQELLKDGASPNEFNQALMELGALVCTPSNTTCEGCPFEEMCACWRGEVVGVVPFVPKAKPVPSYDKSVFILVQDGKILISNEHDDGLMEGLFRLPQIEGHLDKEEDYALVHKFSHLHWNIKAYIVDSVDIHHNWFFVPLEDVVSTHPVVTAHRKILQKLHIL